MTDFLAIFDVDGTLVDSQAVIVETMTRAFEKNDITAPDPAEVRSLIGLSLNVMIGQLTERYTAEMTARVMADYRLGFVDVLERQGRHDLFPGVAEGLKTLADRGVTLGIATGKSQRGLDRLIASEHWGSLFSTRQCADFHPSKPHPSMIRQAMADAMVEADRAVMIGDSTYDVEMATAAGIEAIGVDWGYHSAEMLSRAGATRIVSRFEDLVDIVLERMA